MRNVLLVFTIFGQLNCHTDNTRSQTQDVEDIRSMQYDPTSAKFKVWCKDGSHETVTSEQIRNNQVCNGNDGGGGDDDGPATNPHVVHFYNSDSCSGSYLGSIKFSDNYSFNKIRCNNARISSPIWAVKFGDGPCFDEEDVSFASGCMKFQGNPNHENVVSFFKTDNCTGKLAATVNFVENPNRNLANCKSITEDGDVNIWGYKKKDQRCVDISDQNLSVICKNHI